MLDAFRYLYYVQNYAGIIGRSLIMWNGSYFGLHQIKNSLIYQAIFFQSSLEILQFPQLVTTSSAGHINTLENISIYPEEVHEDNNNS